ncbi:MAG: hypothetical protein N3A38_02345 [Planctomycetota bacterium]|nr:hypothetical protein [Planctomycetota bacterium]
MVAAVSPAFCGEDDRLPAFPPDALDTVEMLAAMVRKGDPRAPAAVKWAFEASPDEDVLIFGGRHYIPVSKPGELPGIVARLCRFPGHLPAMNLAPLLAAKTDAKTLFPLLRPYLGAQEWWIARNACLLLQPLAGENHVADLANLARGAGNRALRLEAIETLGRTKSAQAVRVLQFAFASARESYEKAACMMALAECGVAEDATWMLRQLHADSIESVFGARAVCRLVQELPARESLSLLGASKPGPRRAGAVLMRELGTLGDWEALLRQAGTLPADVLECMGDALARRPKKELAGTIPSLGLHVHKDWRVSDAWARALGACAAAADERTRDGVLRLLKDGAAQKTKRREALFAALSCVYGLEALGTPAALDALIELAISAEDETTALYAASGVAQSGDEAAKGRLTAAIARAASDPAAAHDAALRAITVAAAVPRAEVVEMLIAILGRGLSAKQREAAQESLEILTGHAFGPDPRPWTQWWEKNKGTFEFYEEKLAKVLAGRFAKDGAGAGRRPEAKGPPVDLLPPSAPRPPSDPRQPDGQGPRMDRSGERGGANGENPGVHDDSEIARSLDLFVLRKKMPAHVRRFGGDRETERAVNLALRWLANHQDPDGKWDGKHFDDLDISGKKGRTGSAVISAGRHTLNIGLSGLALLSFLAASHTHESDESPYRETVRRALRWYTFHQLTDGAFQDQDVWAKGGWNYFNYELGISALALSEAYAMTGDPRLKTIAQRSINKIVSGQVPGGGWRYSPRIESDTSVVGWMVMALKSAAMGGLKVDARAMLGAKRFLGKVCTVPKGFEVPEDDTDSYAYTVGSGYTGEDYGSYMPDAQGLRRNAGAVAAVSRLFMGYSRAHPFCVGVANVLRKNPPVYAAQETGPGGGSFPMYYFYYGSLLMHQMGGDYWEKWNAALKKNIVGAQIKPPAPQAGSWPILGADAEVAGQIYTTTMCALSLEVYYRYLPMIWFK